MTTKRTVDLEGPIGEVESHLNAVNDLLGAAPELTEWRLTEITEHLGEVAAYAKLALQAAEAFELEDEDGDEEDDA